MYFFVFVYVTLVHVLSCGVPFGCVVIVSMFVFFSFWVCVVCDMCCVCVVVYGVACSVAVVRVMNVSFFFSLRVHMYRLFCVRFFVCCMSLMRVIDCVCMGCRLTYVPVVLCLWLLFALGILYCCVTLLLSC